MIATSNVRAALFTAFLTATTALACPAFAQVTGEAGALPNISPDQIARDVGLEFNPRTGEREFVAASFDPFETDSTMAGSAALRSTSGAISIDGERLVDGAILDLGFYYSSASNDPYDTRGFDGAVYLSGEPIPLTLRDSQVLECSSNVERVVYDHTEYYRPSFALSLFRPYRHYRGHYGYSYWDRPYWSRGYRSSGRGHGGWRRGGHVDRPSRGGHSDRDRRRRDRDGDSVRDPGRTGVTRPGRRDRDGDTGRRDRDGDTGRRDREDRDVTRPDRRRPDTGRDTGRDRPDRSRRARVAPGKRDAASAPISRRRAPTSGTQRRDRVSTTSRPAPTRPTTSRPTRRGPDVSRPQTSRPQTSRPQTAPQRSRPAASPTPKRSAAPVSRPRPATSRPAPARSTPKPARESKPTRTNRPVSRPRASDRRLNFYPAGTTRRDVVTSVNSACAREDKLSLFISNARLDAARFDGLTVLVLGADGGEYPVFVPPNYIEGFRLARSGQIIATGIEPREFAQPRNPNPIYEPRPVERQYAPSVTIEAAPCPAGTTPQPDGTCLQTGRYP